MPTSDLKSPIVIWMNQPSHYQTAFFREVGAHPRVSLTVIYATKVAQFRKAMGWEEHQQEKFPQVLLKGLSDTVSAALQHRKAVHVVNGIWGVPKFLLSSSLLLLLGASVYFHGEHPDPHVTRRGIWHVFKRVWVKLVFLRAKGIFVIGRRAGGYYRQMGVPESKIFPFMYVQSGSMRAEIRPNRRMFRIIYVGQFVAWKRVDDLINACAKLALEIPTLELRLIGVGPLKNSYESMIRDLKLSDRARIVGPLPPKEVSAEIYQSDVLVLPSTFDGWGLTVNEALQAGVPAVCSDGCGAAQILEDHPGWGLVFRAGDTAALAAAIRQIALKPEQFRPNSADVEAAIGPRALTGRFLQEVMDSASAPQIR